MVCYESNLGVFFDVFKNLWDFIKFLIVNDKRKVFINIRFYWYLSNNLICVVSKELVRDWNKIKNLSKISLNFC